jgi:hypothetical protein
MHKPLLLSALFLGVAAALVANDAHALGPLDVEIGARSGFGTPPGGVLSGDPNPLGFGIGGRAGVSSLGLYAGISGMYYVGEDQRASGGSSAHSVLLGVEGGVGSKLGPLTLRGTVGVGYIETHVAPIPSGVGLILLEPPVPGTTSGVYIEPGVTGVVGLGSWFVGADANALILPSYGGGSSLEAAFTMHGQVGVKF